MKMLINPAVKSRRRVLIIILCVALSNVALIVFRLTRSEEFVRLIGHHHGVNDVVFHPDGHQLATASDDQTIQLWDVRGNVVNVISGYSDRVTALAYSPSGEAIARATGKGHISIRDVATGVEIHSFQVKGLRVSKDGSAVISVGRDHVLTTWHSGTRQAISSIRQSDVKKMPQQ